MLAVPSIQSPRVQLTGPTAQRVRVQRSLNPRDWEDWQTVILNRTGIEPTDDSVGSKPQFYRAIGEEPVP